MHSDDIDSLFFVFRVQHFFAEQWNVRSRTSHVSLNNEMNVAFIYEIICKHIVVAQYSRPEGGYVVGDTFFFSFVIFFVKSVVFFVQKVRFLMRKWIANGLREEFVDKTTSSEWVWLCDNGTCDGRIWGKRNSMPIHLNRPTTAKVYLVKYNKQSNGKRCSYRL